LRFCEKEPSQGNKIEKTLHMMLPSDRILQHQYRANNYMDLINDLLQAKKHDALTLKDHHQRPVGTARLSEDHFNVKCKETVDGSNNHQKNFDKIKDKFNKHKKSYTKGQSSGKGKKPNKGYKCHKCGGPNHKAKKCHTPQHLVNLYQKSLKDAKGKRAYETHFFEEEKEANTSGSTPTELQKPTLMADYLDREKTIIEYNSNDVFRDLK
jgi:hypothetical protein